MGSAQGAAGWGDWPEKGREGQAQAPAAVAGMVPLVLLGEWPVGNPGAKEQLELVQGGAGAGAQTLDLVGEGAGPDGKVRSHSLEWRIRQSIYCPIDSHATLPLKKKTKQSRAAAAQLPAAYRRLRARLGQMDWVALGSVLERGLPGQGGPRYQWSRRAQGKTVRVALSPAQVHW